MNIIPKELYIDFNITIPYKKGTTQRMIRTVVVSQARCSFLILSGTVPNVDQIVMKLKWQLGIKIV